MTLADFVSRLRNARRSGNGYKALCPAHDDRTPSLSVSEGQNGGIVIHCFAGCRPEEIVRALGLEMKDLEADGALGPSRPSGNQADEKERKAYLNRLYRETKADDGTLRAYLRGRGLSIDVPAALRLHPSLAYWDEGKELGRFPAMVALVTAPGGSGVALHRTYLAPGGGGKADVPSPKKLTQPVRGGATRGAAIRLAEAWERLALAEGIETALAVMEATGAPAWATISAGGMEAVDVPEIVRRVDIWADNDPEKNGKRPGQDAARRLADRLTKEGREVRVLVPEREGTDWLDVLNQDGPEALRDALASAEPWIPSKATEEPEAPARPRIRVNGRFLRDISADALEALRAANDPPWLFLRGDAKVRIAPDGPPEAEALTTTALKGILDRVADFVNVKIDDDGNERPTPARPPGDLAPDILALPNPPFPKLRSISTVPVFLPGGRLLACDGYDEEAGLLLRLRGIEEVTSDMPADEARRFILGEMLADFPFADDAGRAHTVAMLIERFVRPLISGPTPIYLVDAPAQGTGKGLLVETISLVVMGAPAPVMALPRDKDEVEKRITAMLMTGSPVILLDNVTSLESTSLAAVLTAEVWRGRPLGKSEIVHLPNDATWIATGNNVELSHETARRAIPIRLDAGMERPEERQGFRHPDLPGWVRRHRTELVSACLSLVRAWVNAGMPKGAKTLGRFESWAQVMGGILEVAGIPGFLEGRDRLYAEADRETREWEAFAQSWWEEFSEEPVTAGKLFPIAKERGLLMDVWAGKSHTAAMQRLGHALARRRDRVFGAWVIRTAGRDSKTRNAAYRLELRGNFENTRNTRNDGEAAETTSQTTFAGTSAAGVWVSAPSKTTAETPAANENTREDTRSGNARQEPVSGVAAGVMGVSGVSILPHTAREVGEL